MIKYLVKKNNTYWYRRKINNYGEILLSLKSKNYQTAIIRHAYIDLKIKQLISQGAFIKMTVDEIRAIIEKYKTYMIENDYNDFEDQRDRDLTIELNGQLYGGHTQEALEYYIEKYHTLHSSNDDELIKEEALKILQRSNVQEEYKKLTNDKEKKIFHWEFFKAELELLYQSLQEQKDMIKKNKPKLTLDLQNENTLGQLLTEFTKGMLNSDLTDEVKKLHLQLLNKHNPRTNSLSILELVEEYINEKRDAKKWTDKNERDIRYVFNFFAQYYENKDVNFLSRLEFSKYRDNVLKNLPKRIIHSRFTDKSIHEVLSIVESNKIEKVQISTVNKHLRRLHQVFNWATDNGYTGKNFCKDLYFVDKTLSKNKRSKKTPYEQHDLENMFSSPYFTNELEITLKNSPEHVFFPLIAMYTGAKAAEIALLKVTDIIQIDGLLCFDFNNNVKNKFTNRKTPISDKLLEIGFMDYVKYQKKYKEEMLFEKVKFYSDKNINFTNKFSIYNRKYITQEKEKTFYSFKHLVNQSLKNTKTPIYTINDIVGHSDGKGNRDIEDYGAESQPVYILKEAIEKSLKYEYLNFSHITATIKRIYK